MMLMIRERENHIQDKLEERQQVIRTKYKEISASAITNINHHGICFSDGERLLFEKCMEVRKRRTPSSRAVAVRDIMAVPPYFQFYATEEEIPLRIVFDRRGLFSKSRNQRQFQALRQIIEKAGYQTYDLS